MTPTSERTAAAGAWLLDLHGRAQAWVARVPRVVTARTGAYVDLVFAFGLARVGASASALGLLEQSRTALAGEDESHTWLYQAYQHRVKQAMEGKPHTGPLPAEHIAYLETIDRLRMYVIDRLRKHSRILDPDVRRNPYRWGEQFDPVARDVRRLLDLSVREEFVNLAQRLLEQTSNQQKRGGLSSIVLGTILDRSPFAGEELSREAVDRVLHRLENLAQGEIDEVQEVASLLERALRAAEAFSLRDQTMRIIEATQQLLRTIPPRWSRILEGLVGECGGVLLRQNLCDEADQFLNTTASVLLEGRTPGEWPVGFDETTLPRLHLLLGVAAGWYAFGWGTLADPILERTLTLLTNAQLPPRDQAELGCASARAVRLATRDVAEAHFRLFFEHLPGVRDTYTTSSHFSVSQLDVIESVVLSAVEVCGRT